MTTSEKEREREKETLKQNSVEENHFDNYMEVIKIGHKNRMKKKLKALNIIESNYERLSIDQQRIPSPTRPNREFYRSITTEKPDKDDIKFINNPER